METEVSTEVVTQEVMKKPKGRPRAQNYESERELDKVEKQFNKMDREAKELSYDKLRQAPLREVEPQTKLSQKDIANSTDIYLKPIKQIPSREKFNERFRDDYNFQKQYVYFIAENKEIIGEALDMWTKPFPGMPAEEWKVPTNKPVWGPRYLAEQIKRKTYRVFKMNENKIADNHETGQYYGQLCVEETVERLTARPVSTQRSIFMGAESY